VSTTVPPAAEAAAIAQSTDRASLVANLKDVGSPVAQRIEGIPASHATTLWVIPAAWLVSIAVAWGLRHGLPPLSDDARAALVAAVASFLPTAAAMIMRIFFTTSPITSVFRQPPGNQGSPL
jgi:hypothetical protein